MIIKETQHLVGTSLHSKSKPVICNHDIGDEIDRNKYDGNLASEYLRAKYFGLWVLVAEDNIIISRILLILLKNIGFLVDVAKDGQEALDLAGGFKYSLIITDIDMPRMNGLEAMKAIRQLKDHATTPIVACTSNSLSKYRTQFIDAGINGYVKKPVVPRILHLTLFDVLENFFGH